MPYGIYGGLAWIQFDSSHSYQKLLHLVNSRNGNSTFINWLCGGLSPNGKEIIILCKPLVTGDMKIDMYVHPCDIPFFEESLVSLKKIKSKL